MSEDQPVGGYCHDESKRGESELRWCRGKGVNGKGEEI